jgi:hypothetical protein
MLNDLLNKIDRVVNLGATGPWWWRPLGGVISLVVLLAVWLGLSALRH